MTKTAKARHRPLPTSSDDGSFSMDWSDRFALGVAVMDQQHQVLFRLIDELAQAMLDETPDAALQPIFDRLHEYTLTHFATEEKLMAKYGYPADRDHHANHRALEASLAELVERAAQGEPLVSLQTMNFLRQWLYEHIDGVDRRFADFLKSQGAGTTAN